MNYFLNNELRTIQVKSRGQPGAGATRLAALPLTLVAPAPGLAWKQIRVHDTYTADLGWIADGYTTERYWLR